MSDAAAKVEGMVKALNHQRIVAHIDVANCTLFIYEVIVNLPDEIDHIWRRKWSFFTALYIVQRYLPLFDLAIMALHHSFGANLNTQYCTLNYKIAAWSYITGVMLSEIALTLRVWAVWHGGRLVTIVLATFFLACWVPCCILFGRFLDAMEFINLPYPNPHGCVIGGGSTILIACWVLWMVYDIAALVMILIPGVAAFRRGGMSEVMRTVYQDGVVYYALMCLCSMTNVIVILRLSPDLVNLLSSFERVLHSILTSRAILHIRQVHSQYATLRTISQIQFAESGSGPGDPVFLSRGLSEPENSQFL